MYDRPGLPEELNIAKDISPDLPSVFFDPETMRRFVVNLINKVAIPVKIR